MPLKNHGVEVKSIKLLDSTYPKENNANSLCQNSIIVVQALDKEGYHIF